MRKDVRTGMFIGIGLVFVGWVLFALYSETPQQRRQKRLANENEPAALEFAPVPPAPASSPQTLPKPSVQPPAEQSTPAEQTPGTQIHVVQPGQTLSSIATLYYGRADDWQKILEANSDVLQDPSQIRPGMRLKISPQ